MGIDGCAPIGRRSWALTTSRNDREAVWVIGRRQVRWLPLLAAGGTAVVALELVWPVAYHAPALRAVTESLVTLVALLGTVLLGAQFGHTRRRRDLILFGALLLFTALELTAGALPTALELHSGGPAGAAMVLGQLFVAGAIAAAAFTSPHELVTNGGRPVAIGAAMSLVAYALAWLGGVLADGTLVIAGAHARFGLGVALAKPVAVAGVLATSALLAYAAVQFERHGNAAPNGAMSLFAGGLILMAAARLYYFAMPSLSPDWTSPREGLRFVALLLFVAAAARQQSAIRAAAVRAAEIAERRRVARDLHDGLAQDLALIVAHGQWMAREFGAEHPVTVAARRALEVSRGTISDLSDPRSATAKEALEALAHELSGRYQMAIAVHADVGDLPADEREHVLRIAREAICNAGRHGGAKNVVVSLRRTRHGLALLVQDDGCGLGRSGGATWSEGFGLRSMRERAATLGGDLTVREPDRGGTELEVVVP